jgi:hypothetical protein
MSLPGGSRIYGRPSAPSVPPLTLPVKRHGLRLGLHRAPCSSKSANKAGEPSHENIELRPPIQK